MTSRWRLRGAVIIAAAALPVLAFAFASPRFPLRTFATESRAVPQAGEESEPRRELVAILITAEFCLASRTEGFPSALAEMNQRLSEKASQDGRHYVKMGIGIDWDPEVSLAALRRYGEFDEIAVGHNWYNTGVRRYIWGDMPGQPTVPQIVLLERTLHMTPIGVEFLEEIEVARIVGVPAILEWIESGAIVK